MICVNCGNEAGEKRRCPYCGEKPWKRPMFTDEEILALGLYPKDEGYKMSLISRILGKKK